MLKKVLNLAPLPIVSIFKNAFGSQNIQAAKELVEQSFTPEQKADILAFSKEFGGDLQLQGRDSILTKGAAFLSQKYGVDSNIAKVANALEDYSKAHNKSRAREDLLTLIRADEKKINLGILLNVASNSVVANKALRDIFNTTSFKLKKEIESLGIKENDFREVFKGFKTGTQEDYDEAFNKILGELYQDERVIIDSTPYKKYREQLGDLIALDPQGMQFLKFIEQRLYDSNGVTFSQLENARKFLNTHFKNMQNPSTKEFLERSVMATIREDIKKGIDDILLLRPELFEKAKKLHDTALSDYSAMNQAMSILEKLDYFKKEKTNAQVLDNILRYIQGSGGLAAFLI